MGCLGLERGGSGGTPRAHVGDRWVEREDRGLIRAANHTPRARAARPGSRRTTGRRRLPAIHVPLSPDGAHPPPRESLPWAYGAGPPRDRPTMSTLRSTHAEEGLARSGPRPRSRPRPHRLRAVDGPGDLRRLDALRAGRRADRAVGVPGRVRPRVRGRRRRARPLRGPRPRARLEGRSASGETAVTVASRTAARSWCRRCPGSGRRGCRPFTRAAAVSTDRRASSSERPTWGRPCTSSCTRAWPRWNTICRSGWRRGWRHSWATARSSRGAG